MERSMSAAPIPYFSDDDARACLPIPKLTDAMTAAFIAYSTGKARQPERSVVSLDEKDARMLTMPAVGSIAGVKIVTVAPVNPQRELPSHQALFIAFNKQTGSPIAMMDATYLTEIRTACASAAAARALMSITAQTKLAIIGAGVQARSHIRVFRELFNISDITIASRNAHNAAALAAQTGCNVSSTTQDAVKDCSLIIAATSSKTPALLNDWIVPGSLVISVGAPFPDWRELDDALISQQLIVDSRAGCQHESGDIVATNAHIHGEIGAVLNGEVEIDVTKTRVFKSGGLAIEDVEAASLVLKSRGLR